MDWILRNIPLLVVLFVAFQIVRAVLQAKKAQERESANRDETDEQRRIREIQEQIRRKIAERRGEVAPAPPRLEPPPVPVHRGERPPPVPTLDPFGGGGRVRRVFEEIERRLQPPPAPIVTPSRAELERQAQLEDELRAANETREIVRRRAAHAAAERSEAEHTESALLTSSRAKLLADLGDPQSLRRAFLLREVLGPPLGLR